MSERFRCRVGRHRWVHEEDGSRVSCLYCGAVGRRRKTALCRLGLHNWALVVRDGAQYVECRRCGHYGGDRGSFNWVPNRDR
jgi:uncharacterized C2H2 Zn-finger protein